MYVCLPIITQLACFGIMASFDKALEVCQQQQQQHHQPQPDRSLQGLVLAAFWQLWRSYVPTGLLAVAAAGGQPPPDAVVLQAHRAEWQGPWLVHMQQLDLQHNLAAMADLYDQVLEQQQQQDGQLGQGQQHAHQQHVPCGGAQHTASGLQPGAQQQHVAQQLQQWPCQQRRPPHPPLVQQQQPYQQGRPQSTNMGPPNNVQRRCMPASLQQPQRNPAQSSFGSGSATGPGGAGVNHTGRSVSGAGHVHSTPAAAAATAGTGQRPQLQLSQSAQQPKRAAMLSAKSQLAAQKRSKLAAGQAGGQLAMAAADESDNDDDFL